MTRSVLASTILSDLLDLFSVSETCADVRIPPFRPQLVSNSVIDKVIR